MGIEANLPTIGIVLGSAAIDSINPCAIGVLILMISVVLTNGQSTRRLLALGGLYIFAIFMTYLLAGLGLVYFFASVPLAIAEYISIAVGIFVIIAGLLEVKEFFWYGAGFSLSIPVVFTKKIHELSQNLSIPGVMFLGVFVAAVELPCTGAPYLAIITLLSRYFDFTAFLLMVLYNIVFVFPLILILILVAAGANLQGIKQWKQDSRGYMRLFIGLLLIALGWLLILISNGTINFG